MPCAGPQAGVCTTAYPFELVARGAETVRPATLGKRCWVGGHTTVTPGATLDDNVIVGNPEKIIWTLL